jgi:hypothetical protein
MDSSSSRLEVVRWWRSQLELKARKASVDAQAQEERARQEQRRIESALEGDPRAKAQAGLWELADLSQAAAERKLREAKEVTRKAAEVADQRRASHIAAAKGLKSIENVVQGLLADARAEAERKERRDTDELAAIRFARAS